MAIELNNYKAPATHEDWKEVQQKIKLRIKMEEEAAKLDCDKLLKLITQQLKNGSMEELRKYNEQLLYKQSKQQLKCLWDEFNNINNNSNNNINDNSNNNMVVVDSQRNHIFCPNNFQPLNNLQYFDVFDVVSCIQCGIEDCISNIYNLNQWISHIKQQHQNYAFICCNHYQCL